jgi:energy-coupling factor transporter ATP-binding protein EcfA2
MAHSLAMYGTPRDFVKGVYQQESPLPGFCFPWCLTGLAGVGKSALLSALARLMPQPSTVTAVDGTEFPLVSYRAITVRACSTSRDILTQLAQREGSVRQLSEFLRRIAYRDGWALVSQDEFQFATQSENASTRITQMILSVCYIGVPPVYAANFSLLHKLNSRNQEDRHRLLWKVDELHPDAAASEDWRVLLRLYHDIAPELFVFDPDGDAKRIHNLTAAVKRNVVSLLEIGSAEALRNGGVVDYSTLERAYRSREYATFRHDVEALCKLYGAFRNTRKDLWNPLSAVVSPSEDPHGKQERQARADAKALADSLTVAERKELATRSKKAVASGGKVSESKLASTHIKKSDAERLRENNSWFSNKL